MWQETGQGLDSVFDTDLVKCHQTPTLLESSCFLTGVTADHSPLQGLTRHSKHLSEATGNAAIGSFSCCINTAFL